MMMEKKCRSSESYKFAFYSEDEFEEREKQGESGEQVESTKSCFINSGHSIISLHLQALILHTHHHHHHHRW